MSVKPFIKELEKPCAYEFIGHSQGRCLYVPSYQRSFTWGDQDVDRFFESVAMGMRRIVEGHNGAVFLGTVIALSSRDRDLLAPDIDGALPSEICHVIDGQQRLTLLVATSVVLHDFIRYENLAQNNPWLGEQCEVRLRELSSMFEAVPFNNGVRYPRMIRWGEDAWSEDGQQYRSPLSALCSGYGEFSRQDNAGGAYSRSFPPAVDNDVSRKAHAAFVRAERRVRNAVRKISEGNSQFPFPDVSELSGNESILREFFPKDSRDSPMDTNFADAAVAKVARVAALANHILRNVQFVTLVTDNEEQALEIFQSLNTTGDPLTAVETFKPEVVRAEGLKKYDQPGSSKEHLDGVEGLWMNVVKPENRHKLASDLVISFALAESGKRLSANFGVQREYLRNSYRVLEEISGKRLFTRHLMYASEIARLWDKKKDVPLYGAPLADNNARAWEEACFCLDFLRDARHTIAQALITRFHEAASNPSRGGETLELFAVIKATAAFFALWRGCSKSRTATGIDDRHRDLMGQGIMMEADAAESDILPFARRPPLNRRVPAGGPISADEVKRAFRHFLRKGESDGRGAGTKEEWVNHSVGVPLGANAKQVARFLLLTAAHDAVPKGSDGMLKAGKSGVRPLIRCGAWGDKDYKTVEHIVPRAHKDRLRCTLDDLHPLGNLTLLPADLNNDILGNREWPERKAIYTALSAEAQEERDHALESCGFLTEAQRGAVRNKSGYFPMTAAPAQCEDFTSRGHIEARGRNLAELAWQRLAVKWLGFPEPDGD